MIYILLALMILAWSGNFVVAKLTLRELPPLALLSLRIWLSSAVLLAAYVFSRPRGRGKLRRGDWTVFSGLGLVGVALNQAGFTLGIDRTTVGHSSLIIALSPVFVIVLAAAMKMESVTRRKVLGVGLCFSGIAVLAGERGVSSNSPTFAGDIITLGGSFAFALYTVYGKKVSTRYDTLTLTTFVFAAGAVLISPIGIWQILTVRWIAVTWRGWLGVAYMALIASVLAYLIFYYALTRIPASRVIVLTYLQPVLATGLGILLLGEEVTPELIVGGLLVLTGVYLAGRSKV